MRNDIETLVRAHFQAVDEQQLPVDREEVTHRALTIAHPASSPRRRQGPLYALAAAAGVLILVGGLTWLLSPPSDVTATDPVAATDIEMRVGPLLDGFLGSAVNSDEAAFAKLITPDFVGYRIDMTDGTVET